MYNFESFKLFYALKFSIKNEFNTLSKVILGIANDLGGIPSIQDVYDPHTRKHVLQKTFPKENQLISELNAFKKILEKYGVDVLRPKNLKSINQVFTRDIGFVIDDVFFISNIIKDREREIEGINHILSYFDKSKIIFLPNDIRVEGGDVIIYKDYIFIGISSDYDFATKKVGRTNKKSVDFFKKFFPKKKVYGFELKKSDTSIEDNCLHLDCCFQTLGLGHLLICYDSFNKRKDIDLVNKLFSKKNIIEISNEQMVNLNTNLFSISKNIVVSNKNFKILNNILLKLGYTVEEVEYSSIAKMGGLFRCSTLPLKRI